MESVYLDELFGYTGKGKKRINPVREFFINRAKYSRILQQYDLDQYSSFLEWNGLPNNLKGWNINRMLYLRGALVGFKFSERIFIQPFFTVGGLSVDGLPVKVTPTIFNGTENVDKNKFTDLVLDVTGENPDLPRGVLLFDSVPGTGVTKAVQNSIIIKDMADTLSRININIVVSNKKIFIIAKDPKQKEIIEKEMESAFSSDSPFCVITSPLEVNTIQESTDYNADDLFNTMKNYDALRCFMSGINSKNFGVEKKERLITDEMNGDKEQSDLIAELRLQFANEFANDMNKIFSTNISVNFKVKENEPEENKNVDNDI